MGILPKRTSNANQDTTVLDRSQDRCAGCGASIPAGDVFCTGCE